MAFADWHGERSLSIKRLYIRLESVGDFALTERQAIDHDLLDVDGKAEVDGLPVPVLDSIVRAWIESNLDPNIQREVVAREPRHAERGYSPVVPVAGRRPRRRCRARRWRRLELGAISTLRGTALASLSS